MIGKSHWPMGGLLHLVQRGETWRATPSSPLIAVPNVTAHPSTAARPVYTLLITRRGTILITPLHSKGLREITEVGPIYDRSSVKLVNQLARFLLIKNQ